MHAAEQYTPKAFRKFQEELHEESAYLMNEAVEYNGNEHIYQLTRWIGEGRIRTVIYDSILQTIKCSCMHFESWGFPCRHSICVMKLENLDSIPDSCFLKRWTKNVKSDFLDTTAKDVISDDVLSLIRYGALTSTAKRLCKLGSKSTTSYKELTSDMRKWVRRLEEENHLHMPSGEFEGIQYPKRVRTKGMRSNQTSKSSQSRKCENCRTPGHTRTTCPLRIGGDHTMVASNDESEHNDAVSTDGYNQREVLITHSTQDARMVSSQNMMSTYGSTEFQFKEVQSRFYIGETSKRS
ncbi:protein FAR1-RELATED SEQUENCE 1-like isoform X2 [Euphorbia lathyris]|uniref:protein FAR1-RELATED SEQUENCE 1-like isoform X2 n=1 Tax=Euphorbia lathyris TaxID=212925 RepID=UPI00331448DE